MGETCNICLSGPGLFFLIERSPVDDLTMYRRLVSNFCKSRHFVVKILLFQLCNCHPLGDKVPHSSGHHKRLYRSLEKFRRAPLLTPITCTDSRTSCNVNSARHSSCLRMASVSLVPEPAFEPQPSFWSLLFNLGDCFCSARLVRALISLSNSCQFANQF